MSTISTILAVSILVSQNTLTLPAFIAITLGMWQSASDDWKFSISGFSKNHHSKGKRIEWAENRIQLIIGVIWREYYPFCPLQSQPCNHRQHHYIHLAAFTTSWPFSMYGLSVSRIFVIHCYIGIVPASCKARY